MLNNITVKYPVQSVLKEVIMEGFKTLGERKVIQGELKGFDRKKWNLERYGESTTRCRERAYFFFPYFYSKGRSYVNEAWLSTEKGEGTGNKSGGR